MEAIGDFGGSAGGANMVVGTPIEVADRIQQLVEEAGIDGINLAQVTTPGTVKDFIELVLPELQNRGLVKEEYEEGSYRQKTIRGQRSTARPSSGSPLPQSRSCKVMTYHNLFLGGG